MNELIPELHDIGKLQKKYKHNFEDAGYTFESKTWRGILEHHCSRNFEKYPLSLDTFKLKIADKLASAVSREYREDGCPIYNVYKLWNPTREEITIPPLRTEKDIKELIEFTVSVSTFEDFVIRYEKLLKYRTEDAHPKSNLTSLYTHMLLTGKLYRILSAIDEYTVHQEIFQNKDAVCRAINEKMNEWKLRVVRCKINFSQSPIRAKDMNVFVALNTSNDEIKHKFKDNILFSFSNELFLITVPREDIVGKISALISKNGFWIEVYGEDDIKLSTIANRGTNIFENLRNPKVVHYQLEKEIAPPICEICQMRKATPETRWVDEESGIIEELCEYCFKIRQIPEVRLKKLVNWSSEAEIKVVYLKISLSTEQLMHTLNQLYRNYTGSNEHVSLSIISEFQWDYEEFLKEFVRRISIAFNEEDIQLILNDFLGIKIERTSDIKKILEIYSQIFKQYFPEFIQKSPIRLSISCSSAKFPFFWHWRILNDTKDEINVSMIGKGEMHLKFSKLDELLSIDLPNTRMLHNLDRISQISKKLAWIMLNDRSDRRMYKEFEGLKRAVLATGISYSSILTYAKIMGD